MFKNWNPALGRVRAALRRRGRSKDEADDLVQEACLRYAEYELHTPITKPLAFLMRAAINLSIDAHRARATRGEEVSMDDVSLADPQPGPEATFAARQRVKRLDKALRQMDKLTRSIYVDIRIHGVSYRDVAKRRRLSISTVEREVAKGTMIVTQWMEGW